LVIAVDHPGSPDTYSEVVKNKDGTWEVTKSLKGPPTQKDEKAESKDAAAKKPETSAIDEIANYATPVGIEASIVATAMTTGANAKELTSLEGGASLMSKVSKASSLVGWAGVAVSGIQTINDISSGNVEAAKLHALDTGVNAVLLSVTAVCPATAPFTFVIGLGYNAWSIAR
jgi:hypothetical protein